MHGSDESFTGSRSFYRFQEAVQRLFGHAFVIPCHQGRAGEHLLARAVVRPGDVIFANTHFATTRENFEEAGAEVRDLPIKEALDRTSPHPFKGNIDLERLEAGLAEVGARARMVILTVTDNSRGGQPVSMANVRAAHGRSAAATACLSGSTPRASPRTATSSSCARRGSPSAVRGRSRASCSASPTASS